MRNFDHLRIGRFVPEYAPSDQLAVTEIALHNFIFDISGTQSLWLGYGRIC